MKIVTTACPRNCYSTCTFRVSVRENRIGLIEPDPDNLATAEGVCLKSLSYAGLKTNTPQIHINCELRKDIYKQA
ncbi:MAG: hypothetical protein KAS18_10810 [Calditrichia bacterium]|nr:hypothetical protein [Calditrichia bacterium]